MPHPVSCGGSLWSTFLHNLRAYQHGPEASTQTRAILWDVTPHGHFVNGLSADSALARARNILVQSGRIYRWEDTLCYEVQEHGHEQLFVLGTRQKAQPGAAAVLSNIFCVGVRNEESSSQALPPVSFVNALLADELLWKQLPAIRHYGRRPVFDRNFILCGPGWHPDAAILVHGPDITPALPPLERLEGATVLDRLPPFTRTLLQEFCWRSEADLINALAVLLTGFLINHLVEQPHPMAIIDGNQPGVGKTLFVQATSLVLDDCESPRIPLGSDEELEKKLCSRLLEGRSGLFFLDNVRNQLESALLEANVLSPLLSFRILKSNVVISRPNTYLWAVTSNLASGNPDMVRRGIPVRLFYEGDLKRRTFTGDPLEYASVHRLEILGELAGMILYWRQQGMPTGQHRHRCSAWARKVGGILLASGLGDSFLANLEAAEADMDATLQGLATLAEWVVSRGRTEFFCLAGASGTDRGKPPRDWTPLFLEREIGREKLMDRSPKGRDTWVGQFLSAKVESTVDITTPQGIGTATLCMREGRSRQKLYFFEVGLAPESEVALPAVGALQTIGEDLSSVLDVVPSASPVSAISATSPALPTIVDPENWTTS
ncbi:MAG: hypothetical protein ACYC3I_27625 [Gemmataceae bacterium]